MSLVFPHTFVPWFRAVAPYIHAYRGKTFVVAMAGELIAAGKLNAFVQDLAILHAMGIKLVLVHGFRPQVNEQLRGQGPCRRASATACASPTRWRSTARRRPPASCASRSRPRSRRACRTRRWPTPRCAWCRATSSPRGRWASSTAWTSCTAAWCAGRRGGHPPRHRHRRAGAAVSPFGFSPTGEAFNLTMEDVATSTAIALQADKLLFLTEVPGIRENPDDPDSAIDTELALADAERLLAALPAPTQPTDTAFYLQHCVQGLRRRRRALAHPALRGRRRAAAGGLHARRHRHDGGRREAGEPARGHRRRRRRHPAADRALRARRHAGAARAHRDRTRHRQLHA